jgi:hypothetical protein
MAKVTRIEVTKDDGSRLVAEGDEANRIWQWYGACETMNWATYGGNGFTHIVPKDWRTSFKLMIRLAIFAFCCGGVRSPSLQAQQTTAPVPQATQAPAAVVTGATPAAPICPTWYTLFAAYSPASSPKATGGGAVATLLPGVKCTAGFQAYSYSQYVVSAAKVAGVWTLNSTTTSGVAVPMRGFGPFEVWMLGAAGAAVTGSSSTVKLGSTYGGMVTAPKIPKIGVTVAVAFERVNGINTGLIGIMRSFK